MTKYKCGEFVKLPRDGLEEYFSGFEKNFTQIHTQSFTPKPKL